MEKIFKKPEICADCNNELERLFLFCRSCNKFICYDCLSNHENDNYLPCKTLENNKAIVMNVGVAGYGPPMGNLWPSIDIDSFISSYHPKCLHAVDYFEKNNITFFCHECKKWICLDCLNEHLNHSLMLHVGFNNSKDLRQIDPNLYDSNKELVLNMNAFKTTNGNVRLELEINNGNNVSLYDLRVMYTFKDLDHALWYGNAGETINNEDFLCNNITQVEMISPKETLKIDHEFFVSGFLNYDLSTIIGIVRFKDVFLGGGIAIKEAKTKIV